MNTHETNLAVAALTPESPQDAVLEAMTRVDRLKAETKEIAALLETAVIEWIKTNGDLTMGTVRFYVGPDRSVKLVDKAQAVRRIFEALLPVGQGWGALLEQAVETTQGNVNVAGELLREAFDKALARFADEALASDGLKAGSVRGLLGEAWGQVFQEEAPDGLKEGKAKKERVQKVDTEWERSRARKEGS
jgi:hypothetical protein